MSRFCLRLLAAVLTAAVSAPATALPPVQSELVIVKKGEKEYHRPACDEISNAKDVVALSRAQATARGLKQHEGCDPEKVSAGDPAGSSQPTIVYVDSSKYYHKKDCAKLGKDARKAELEEAGKKLWPCPTCRPPIRKRKGPGSGPLAQDQPANNRAITTIAIANAAVQTLNLPTVVAIDALRLCSSGNAWASGPRHFT
jgi:hypothetical protein